MNCWTTREAPTIPSGVVTTRHLANVENPEVHHHHVVTARDHEEHQLVVHQEKKVVHGKTKTIELSLLCLLGDNKKITRAWNTVGKTNRGIVVVPELQIDTVVLYLLEAINLVHLETVPVLQQI